MKAKSFFIGWILIVLIASAVWVVKIRGFKFGEKNSKALTEGVLKLRGSQDAPVQIIEYSDFQCPACKSAQPVLETLLEKYDGQVSLVFKHFPLEGHMWAGVAHIAAECANEQGNFWEYHDRLYDEQKNWSGPANPVETFVQYAFDLHLNIDKFGACMSDETIKKKILLEAKTGSELNVRSTPTMFIAGERFAGAAQLSLKGEALIREKLGLPPETQGAA